MKMLSYLTMDAAALGLASCYLCHMRKIPGDLGVIVLFIEYLICWSISNSAFQAVSFVSIQITSGLIATGLYRLSPWHPLSPFPGPILSKIAGLKLAYTIYTGKRHLIIDQLHKKYGTFVRIGPDALSIMSLSAVNTIYAQAECMNKSDAYLLGRTQASGMFFIPDREEHNTRRSRWAGAFTPSALNDYEPAVRKRVKQLAFCMEERLNDASEVDLTQCLQHWSYDLMGDIVFGGSNKIELMSEGDPKSYVQCGQFATMTFEILGAVPWLFNILYHLPLTKDIHALKRFGKQLMRSRRMDTNGPHKDLCAHLLGEISSSDPYSDTSDDLLVEDSVFAIQAGSDSSASVLSFLFYFLISNPEKLKRLQRELDKALSQNPTLFLSTSVLAKLPYLNSVVSESLRLGTPFPGLSRVVPPGGSVIDGTFIPGGTIVGVPAYSMQVSPSHFWPAPLSFVPERWLDETEVTDINAVTDKSALMCFSFGPFSCLGRNLAIREIKIVTAYLLVTFDFTFAAGFDGQSWLHAVSGVRSTIFGQPLLVHLKKRAQAVGQH